MDGPTQLSGAPAPRREDLAENIGGRVVKQLHGHSGCLVLLCATGRTRFVRKISASAAYNDRLRRQMEKQRGFRHLTIRAPAVLDSGERAGLFFFDMEYIAGFTLHTFVSRNTTRSIVPLVRQLTRFVRRNHGEATVDLTAAIHGKIATLQRGDDQAVARHADYCLAHDWSEVPAGYCHGDLTFDNILVRDDGLHLIDFLDSFVDTPYVDFSKLLQDVLLMWSWRAQPRRPFVKNIHIYDGIVEILAPWELELTHRLLVLNLLRALPYARTAADHRFLHTALAHLADRFSP